MKFCTNHIVKQRRLWRVCILAQTRQSIRCSQTQPMRKQCKLQLIICPHRCSNEALSLRICDQCICDTYHSSCMTHFFLGKSCANSFRANSKDRSASNHQRRQMCPEKTCLNHVNSRLYLGLTVKTDQYQMINCVTCVPSNSAFRENETFPLSYRDLVK